MLFNQDRKQRRFSQRTRDVGPPRWSGGATEVVLCLVLLVAQAVAVARESRFLGGFAAIGMTRTRNHET